MNFNNLKYFIDTVNEGSIKAASKLNHVSQPAISQGIKKLEESLQIKLLDHRRNQIQVTKDGLKVKEAALPLFGAIKEYQRETTRIKKSLHGSLIIGISQSLVPILLAPTIAKYSRKYPDIEIEVKVGKTSHLIDLMKNGLIDIGLTIDNGKLESFNKKEIKSGYFEIVGKNDNDKPLLITEERPETLILEKSLKEKDFSKKTIIESWGTIHDLVLANYGYGFLPDFIYSKNRGLQNFSKKFKIPKIRYKIVCFSKFNLDSFIEAKAFLDLIPVD